MCFGGKDPLEYLNPDLVLDLVCELPTLALQLPNVAVPSKNWINGDSAENY
jgi:hypothetical protein